MCGARTIYTMNANPPHDISVFQAYQVSTLSRYGGNYQIIVNLHVRFIPFKILPLNQCFNPCFNHIRHRRKPTRQLRRNLRNQIIMIQRLALSTLANDLHFREILHDSHDCGFGLMFPRFLDFFHCILTFFSGFHLGGCDGHDFDSCQVGLEAGVEGEAVGFGDVAGFGFFEENF